MQWLNQRALFPQSASTRWTRPKVFCEGPDHRSGFCVVCRKLDLSLRRQLVSGYPRCHCAFCCVGSVGGQRTDRGCITSVAVSPLPGCHGTILKRQRASALYLSLSVGDPRC
jgi:hypothetical protein